jgi:hypothetical protein
LNKAVDWLYFTGRLPSDPLGRLFSTVAMPGALFFLLPLMPIRQLTRLGQFIQELKKTEVQLSQTGHIEMFYLC